MGPVQKRGNNFIKEPLRWHKGTKPGLFPPVLPSIYFCMFAVLYHMKYGILVPLLRYRRVSQCPNTVGQLLAQCGMEPGAENGHMEF